MEDVLVQLEGGVEERPDLVLKLVDDLASLLVDEVFEAELVLFQSHLFRVVAVPDGGYKSLNGFRMATFFLLYICLRFLLSKETK